MLKYRVYVQHLQRVVKVNVKINKIESNKNDKKKTNSEHISLTDLVVLRAKIDWEQSVD